MRRVPKNSWLVPTAFAIVFGMLGCATGAGAFYLAAGASSVAIVLALVLSRRDKYDLGLLADVHAREEVSRLDPDSEVDGFDSVLCPWCNEVYSREFGVCPRCGHLGGG